jgi:transcriptional regulator with GAF, ATPase, and Fis domain
MTGFHHLGSDEQARQGERARQNDERQDVAAEREPAGGRSDEIIGESLSLRHVLSRVEAVAKTDATVLLLGETGTGKELIARAIHRHSRRRARPFVVVNCATLPGALVESELFGRERGAFTGAHTTQVGRFEVANQGSILLDEVGEVPLDLQLKLLRVLQEGQIERLGSPRTIQTDVRVIAATNRDLGDEVRQGRFRSDLYYRLNVFPITVPSLRDRREDIPLLVQHFIRKYSRAYGRSIDTVPAAVMRALELHDWPGNVRELENVVQRALIVSKHGCLDLQEVQLSRAETSSVRSATTLADVERSHIQHTLELCRWRIEGMNGAAQRLGIRASTLRSRMVRLGIARPR